MLRISGKGELTRPDRPVPALLYSDGVSRLQLQALDLEEVAPGELRIELDEPPPDAALRDVGHLGEPRIAIGFLTAVAEGYPQQMRFVTTTSRLSRCDQECEANDQWCAANYECYSETLRCPKADSPPAVCQLVRAGEGDPALKEAEPWGLFAGLARSYAVAYVSAPLAARSIVATLLGSPEGLDAGYHVLAVGPASEVEASGGTISWSSIDADRMKCRDAAIDDAVARINAEEGTQYESYDLVRPCGDERSWTSLDGSEVCNRPLAERQALRERYKAALWRARFQRGCRLGFRPLTPVTRGAVIQLALSTALGPNEVQLF